jgi:hypothetical protein
MPARIRAEISNLVLREGPDLSEAGKRLSAEFVESQWAVQPLRHGWCQDANKLPLPESIALKRVDDAVFNDLGRDRAALKWHQERYLAWEDTFLPTARSHKTR